MSDLKKKTITSELQNEVQAQTIKRRKFLKYGIIGGLAVCPVCVILYNKYQLQACTHQLIYPGPFEKGKTSPQLQKLNGVYWDNCYDVSRWKGKDESFYIPRNLYMSYENGSYNIYADFEYVATKKVDFCSEYRIDLFCGKKVFASGNGLWTPVSSENKIIRSGISELDKVSNTWEKIWNINSNTKVVQAALSFEEKSEFVDKISGITLTYRNIKL